VLIAHKLLVLNMHQIFDTSRQATKKQSTN